MQKYHNNIQSSTGQAIVAAKVRVFQAGTVNLATIYEDNEVTTKTQPLTTDSNGEFSFKAVDGDYDVVVAAGVGYEARTYTEIHLEDYKDSSSALLASSGSSLVGFIQSGSNAATQTVQGKDRLRHDAQDRTNTGGVQVAGDWDGATGTDDQTGLQNAITQLPERGTLYITKRHKITSAIQISNKNNIRITGGGRIDLVGGASGAYIFQYVGTCDNIEIDHLKLTGDNDTAKFQTAVGNASGQTLSKLRIHDLDVSAINVGISLTGNSGTCTDAKVRDNNVHDIVGTASGQGYGVHIDNAIGAHVYSNTVDNCSRHAIYQARGSHNKIFDNTIKNHRKDVFTGALVSAMPIVRSSDCEAYGNKFIDCYDGQMEISASTADLLSARNIKAHHNFFYNRKNSISAVTVGEAAIPGTYTTTHVELESNTFTAAHADAASNADILINNGSELVVKGNKFTRTGVNSTARFIGLGNATHISADDDCTNNFIKENEFIWEGATLTDTRTIDLDSDLCTNTSSHTIEDNKYIGAAYEVFEQVTRTNTNFIHKNSLGVAQGIYTATDTTPTVKGINYLPITNAGAVSITALDDIKEGQVVTLRFANANTTLTNAMYLKGEVSYTPGANSTITMRGRSDGLAEEIARSDNDVRISKGTGTIASGATTAVITHGLSVTPTTADITITFAEQGTADYGRWWVSTITATQFTLNVSTDPGASNLDFGWKIVV